jgi:integrase
LFSILRRGRTDQVPDKKDPEKIREVYRKPCSDHGIRRVYVTLYTAFQKAVEAGHLPTNPCKGCAPKIPKRKPRTILDLDEALDFLRSVLKHRPEYFALLVVASTTAMRQGEVFGLEWKHVNLDKAWLDVQQQLTENREGELVLEAPKTDASIRRVYLTDLAVAALRWHREKFTDGIGLIFRAQSGGRIWKRNFSQRVLDPLLELAGVRRVTFHELRHTCNSLLLSEGVSPVVMKEMLGHTSTRMTLDVYGHAPSGAHRAAAQKASALFSLSEFADQLSQGCHEGVREASVARDMPKQKRRKSLRLRRFKMVEMRRLELLTPYMRKNLRVGLP